MFSLGLDQLIEAEARLNDARKRFEESSKSAARALPGILEQLRDHPDERARQAESIVRQRAPDLVALEALAIGGQAGSDGLIGSLRQVASLSLPAGEMVQAGIARLSAADRTITDLAGTPAADARRVAGLLTTALAHYAEHPGQACPVCGGSVLDEDWAITARSEITRLTALARDADVSRRPPRGR